MVDNELNVYKYKIITNPHHPEIQSTYKKIKELIYSDNFSIISKTYNLVSNGIIIEIFKIVVPFEISGINSTIRMNLEKLISNINYICLDYSITIDEIDMQQVPKIKKIIKEYIMRELNVDILYIQVSVYDTNITFTPIDKYYKNIYIKNNILHELDYDEIKTYELISTDTLTPYASQLTHPTDNSKLYKVYKKLFLIKSSNNIYADDIEKVDLIKDQLINLRENGYISLPTPYKELSKKEIHIGAEVILEWGGYLERVEPIIVAKLNTNIYGIPEIWIQHAIDNICDNKLPLYQFNAPSEWIVNTKGWLDDSYIYKLKYFVISSYLEIIKIYPILQCTLSSINVISKVKICGQFPNKNSFDLFMNKLSIKIKLFINNKKNNVNMKSFNEYDDAIVFRWKLETSYDDIKSIIFNTTYKYYVIYETPNYVDIPHYNKNELDIIKEECIYQLNLNYASILNTSNINNDGYNTKNMNLIELLSLFPVEYKNGNYVLISIKDFIKNKDLYIGDDMYVNPYTNVIYPYSYGIKYFNEMINGYFSTPTKFLSGILNKFPYMPMVNINIGSLLMNKYNIDDIISEKLSDNIMYSFEIAINTDNLYVPKDNVILHKFRNNKIGRKRIEIKLSHNYRKDLNNYSLILPSKDPGYIFPLFDIILPKNVYNEMELYKYVNNIWKHGILLSLWGKHIYTQTKKLSISFLRLHPFIVESFENTTKGINTILKLNHILNNS
uniref:Uncharacterized protein n=1 Tax=Pithovirus LCPAC102 TaxID=2506587 RepID=A0A4D5XF60_9VIRU|nr:MAG: hypothetical protein LCPAC102_01380 [Pithovirus LCPAC102]